MTRPLLEINNLNVHFPIKNRLFTRKQSYVKAVNGVDLTIHKGETLGIVGESGCGKSTLARAILGLTDEVEGSILFEGENLLALNKKDRRKRVTDIQMVFQDPFTSLNPRMKVGDIIAAPLRANKVKNMEQEVKELLELVGLKQSDYDKLPHQFSGGQRQRIGIARALILKPKLIVLDEPVSALDVSIQAQIINLLSDLQKQFDLTYIFITHDLSVMNHIADKVAVMYLGKIMEIAAIDSFYHDGSHPYTKALLAAIPFPDPKKERSRERTVLTGELPSPANLPLGCVFHTRCPIATEKCKGETPSLQSLEDNSSHQVACFYPAKESDSMLAQATTYDIE